MIRMRQRHRGQLEDGASPGQIRRGAIFAFSGCQASAAPFGFALRARLRLAVRGLIEVAQCVLDAPPGDVILAVDALGVNLEQHGHAVASPLGDLGGRDTAVQPRRDACVPQVVDALTQR
jgi:hypothetical protein